MHLFKVGKQSQAVKYGEYAAWGSNFSWFSRWKIIFFDQRGHFRFKSTTLYNIRLWLFCHLQDNRMALLAFLSLDFPGEVHYFDCFLVSNVLWWALAYDMTQKVLLTAVGHHKVFLRNGTSNWLLNFLSTKIMLTSSS